MKKFKTPKFLSLSFWASDDCVGVVGILTAFISVSIVLTIANRLFKNSKDMSVVIIIITTFCFIFFIFALWIALIFIYALIADFIAKKIENKSHIESNIQKENKDRKQNHAKLSEKNNRERKRKKHKKNKSKKGKCKNAKYFKAKAKRRKKCKRK